MQLNTVSNWHLETKMGTYTTNLDLYKPTVGEQGWGTLVNENFDKIDAEALVAGVVQLYAGSTAPSGWLICNGQAVSRNTYAALYAAIGTTYGAGDGSTTFNVPNLVNKTVRGASTIGDSGGSDTVSLSTDNLPAHTHDGGGLSAASAGAHTHSIYAWSTYGSTVSAQSMASGYQYETQATSYNTRSAGAHTHSVSGTTGSTGSGSAVTITNPYVMLHYIIKT